MIIEPACVGCVGWTLIEVSSATGVLTLRNNQTWPELTEDIVLHMEIFHKCKSTVCPSVQWILLDQLFCLGFIPRAVAFSS